MTALEVEHCAAPELSAVPPDRGDAGPEASTGGADELANVSELIRAHASERPRSLAVVMPVRAAEALGGNIDFAGLERKIDRIARGLGGLGVVRGARVLVLIPPSPAFFAVTFALFRLGAVPVFLDPAMGRRRVLAAIREVEPAAMIAVPRAHLARWLFPLAFRSVRLAVTVGGRWLGARISLAEVEARGARGPALPAAPTRPGETAAILFTSGSTGAPKGVCYTHGIFAAQVRLFRDTLAIRPGDVDLAVFPPFSLFTLALGGTSAVPEMDTTRPAAVEAPRVLAQIRELGVTYSFGSPAFWTRIADHCEASGSRLSGMRAVLMAGAPAPPALLERLTRLIPPGSDVFTPYGATECLPITLPAARSLLGAPVAAGRAGAGTCVGRPLPGSTVRVIAVDDLPIAELAGADLLPAGQIGELIVSGPTTTPGYFRRPEDDARAKLRDGARRWHRMGDVGYLDLEGRIWFCGRKSQRVETAAGTLFTECCEAIFNEHPRVRRCALVGVGPAGRKTPVIVVEPRLALAGPEDEAAFRAQLLACAAAAPGTRTISQFLFHPALPVDPRHNSKIVREALADWAAVALDGGGQPAPARAGARLRWVTGRRRRA